jgi:hypothetical protein
MCVFAGCGAPVATAFTARRVVRVALLRAAIVRRAVRLLAFIGSSVVCPVLSC